MDTGQTQTQGDRDSKTEIDIQDRKGQKEFEQAKAVARMPNDALEWNYGNGNHAETERKCEKKTAMKLRNKKEKKYFSANQKGTGKRGLKCKTVKNVPPKYLYYYSVVCSRNEEIQLRGKQNAKRA